MQIEIAGYLAVASATFVGMTVQSALGFGYGLFVAPVLLAIISPAAAVTALLGLGMTLNLLILFAEQRKRSVSWRSVGVLMVAALPGLLGGLWLLTVASKDMLQVLVGTLIIAAAAFRWREEMLLEVAEDVPLGYSAYATGLVAGALTTSTGLNGPALALWFKRHAQSPAQFRDSMNVSMFTLSVPGAALILWMGSTEGGLTGLAIVPLLFPVVLAAHASGRILFRRSPPELWSKSVLLLLAFAGVASIAAGTL